MNDTAIAVRGRLRERTAEEIRALLARRRISAAELARRTGLKQSTLARRMTGETAFDVDDLELIAEVLGVSVADLLPGYAREAGQPVITPKPKQAERSSMRAPKNNRPKTRQPDSGLRLRTKRVSRPTTQS